MSVFVLGSREVVTAFALGGMAGKAVARRSEAKAALEETAARSGVKILVVEEAVAEMAREVLDRLKLDPHAPLVVEVPGLAGPAEERRSARDLVRRALGIRI